MRAFTAAQLAKEAEREMRYRQFVYSRLVGEGKLKADLAQVRIDMMEEIRDRLAEMAEVEEPQKRLI